MTSNMSPPDGPLQGIYIRNAQAIAPGLWLVEAQRGKKGTGKVWYPTIVHENPGYDPTATGWHEKQQWQELAVVKPGTGYRGQGMFKVMMWFWPNFRPQANWNPRRWVEAYFETELLAVQFMVRNAPEFIKP